MYQITFYVPASHLDEVKQALFAAGAGRYRSYDQCSWQTLGQSQFRPLVGAQPYLGVAGQLTKIAEYKVEMICESASLRAALSALFASHPYEQPAYSVQKILNASDIAD